MPLRKISIKPSPPKAMTRLPAATSNLKEELLKWICERHATNGPLDRQLLRDKALGLATSLGVTGFKCSEAWLTVFLKKHGFSPSLTNCSGPTFPDYRVWIDLLRSLITQYRHKDLFNVDELRMYSDFVPARISGSLQVRDHFEGAPETPAGNLRSDWSSDRSPKTNQIGMLVCCNSSGTEKLRPLISGPYALEDSGRDFRYHRNEDSSITDDLFGEWLAALNEDMSSSGRKILLLLSRDRIRSVHNAPGLSNVNLLFFPKDFPTQLRPLRGDVFHSVKMTHRSRYAERIRSADGEWRPEEIVRSLARAWAEVPRELIVSSFQKTRFREDDTSLKIECPAWDCLGTGVSFRRFVTFDDDLSETSSGIPEDLKLSVGNGHQYNLRRSRRDTVDLVVIDGDSINAPRGRKASKRSAVEETGSRPVEASNDDRSSSGLRKKQKMAEEIVVEERQDGPQEWGASVSSETRDRRLVERIEDSLENVADPSLEDDAVAASNGDRSSSGLRKKQQMAEERQDGPQECRTSVSSGTRDRRLVERVEDFLENVADPSLEDVAMGASSGRRSSSGLRKKQKMAEERQDGPQECGASVSSETRNRRLVERVEDFLESVADPSLEDDALAASNGDRSSSGLRKKQQMAEERQDGPQESRASVSSNATRDRSLVRRIEDFLESVADPSLEDEPVSDPLSETSGADRNHENVDFLINEICQRSSKTRSLMERCLRTITAGDGASRLDDEDTRVARSPQGDSMEEVDSVRGEIELGEESRTGRVEGTARNSTEAATSGQGATAEDTSGFENPPVVEEFDDGDEEIPIAGRLSLKIIEAIECCDEIERSDRECLDINHLQAGDDGNDPRTSKRTRDFSDEDDDGPAKKRARPDESWSKRYEKNFVFGPELRDSASQSVEASLDEPPAQSNGPRTRSKTTQTRGGELEKRCIFTLDGDSPGVSYPKD